MLSVRSSIFVRHIHISNLKITLLGTGTSQGVPVIGCKCDACTSTDLRDQRSRCSVLIQSDNSQVVIDVGPDFRTQMLRAKVETLDAVFLTHEHNDHIIGMDDLRPFLFRSKKGVKIHAEKRVLDELQKRFEYAFTPQPYPGAPSFKIHEIYEGEKVAIGDLEILPLRVIHGRLPILGFKVGEFAYLTDTNHIPYETIEILKGCKILVVDALRERSHHSHFSLQEAIDAVDKIKPGSAYFTHISHLMGPTSKWEKMLPSDIYPSYDGQEFEL